MWRHDDDPPKGRFGWPGIQSPLVGAFVPALSRQRKTEGFFNMSQSPLVGASGPAQCRVVPARKSYDVSIPSGRGFWAGSCYGKYSYLILLASIPSGRGFWAGQLNGASKWPPKNCLNPLWSGLLGRPQMETAKENTKAPSQSPLVGASGPAR